MSTEKVSIISGGEKIDTTIGAIAALAKGIKLNEIRAAVPELEARCKMKIDHAETFSNLCKLVSLKAGVDAGVLSSYITACVKQTVGEKKDKLEQLTLLFDELKN